MVEGPANEKSVFLQALDIVSAAERAAFLDAACGDNSRLRAGVDSLLKAHEKPQELLDNADFSTHPLAEAPARDGPGTVIGPYKILQQLGEGGMGTVFMAEQREPIDRRVALKIIKPGMDSDLISTRFQAERQALALMDHPNIARVLDAGTTTTGRPFFVMELVKGIPINHYCDEHQLTVRERLALIVPVCQAVQHAHQKGIIHRDLKPSNVLVADYDHTPVPKIIDFGVAKALSQRLTDKTMFTLFGQVVGTLEYMSPEQAKLNQLDIDTRSDVYSLGVMLYELLTGTTPFQKERLRTADLDEVLRIIKEEEPPKPSTRLSSSETLPALAANRKMEPAKLNKAVRGELDWIVMKCLEKERGRRYETASALAADLQRYLNDEAVQACPPSAGYRLKKLARRNRGPVLAAMIVVMAMVGGTMASIWQAVRATRAEQNAVAGWADAESNAEAAAEAGQKADQARIEAEQAGAEVKRAAARAQAVNTFLIQGVLGTATAWNYQGQQAVMVQMLNNATTNLDLMFAGQPEAEASVRLTIGELYYSLQLPSEAEPHLRRGLDLRRAARTAPLDPLKPEDAETLYAMKHLGELLKARGEWAEAEPLLRESQEGLRRAQVRRIPFTQPDMRWDFHVWDVAFSSDSRHVLACADDHAFRLYDVATGTEIHRFDGHTHWISNARFSPDGRQALSSSADMTVRLWDMQTARELRQFKGHTAGVTFVDFSPDGRQALSSSVDKTIRLWDLETGGEVRCFQAHTAVVNQAIFTPDGRRILSGGADGTVRLWDADTGQQVRLLLETQSQVQSVAVSPDGLRALSMDQGGVRLWDLDTGEELRRFEGSWLGWAAFAPDGRHALRADHYHRKLSLFDLDTGKDLRSVSMETPLRLNRGVISPDGRLAACGGWRGAVFLWRLEDALSPEQALAEARKRLESVQRDRGPNHPDTLAAVHDLAALLWDQDKPAEAEIFFRQSLEAKGRALGADHLETLFALRVLAAFLEAQDKPAEAEPLLRRYVENCGRALGRDHPDVLVGLGDLSRLLRDQGRWVDAEPFLRQRYNGWRRVDVECIESQGALKSLAEALVVNGKPAEAEALYREQFERRQGALPRGNPDLIQAKVHWAISLIEMGEAGRAIAPLREVLQVFERDMGEYDDSTVAVCDALGWALTENGLARDAEPLLARSVQARRASSRAGNWRRANSESLLGGCLLSLKQFDKAEPLLLDSYDKIRTAPGCPITRRLQALDRLIQLYEALGKPSKSAEWRALRPEALKTPTKVKEPG